MNERLIVRTLRMILHLLIHVGHNVRPLEVYDAAEALVKELDEELGFFPGTED